MPIQKSSGKILLIIVSFIFVTCQTEKKEKQDFSFFSSREQEFRELLKVYEDPEREKWQNPELIIDVMGNLNGKVVADIGAGSGYFTFPLSEKADKVIAIDIDKRFLSYIDEKIDRMGRSYSEKIETRNVAADDPGLKSREADKVLIVNTYHFFDERENYLRKIASGITKEGTIYIVDFKKEKQIIGPSLEDRIAAQTVVQELKNAGFTEIVVDKMSLQYQYIVIAKIK